MEYEPLSKREEEIAKIIVDSAYNVHKELGPGLLRKLLRQANLTPQEFKKL